MLVTRRRVVSVVVVIVLAVTAAVVPADQSSLLTTTGAVRPAGRWVTIVPPLGRVTSPIRSYMTNNEIRTVARVQSMINSLHVSGEVPLEGHNVTWHIESGMSGSQTLALQRRILYALDRTIEASADVTRDWSVDIVVARTQSFIRTTLQELSCNPSLERFGGLVLMGAAVCGRHVIVSNITGFLFLVRADQNITSSLESRPEPPVSAIPYRIMMRNSSALAHEYVHIWRAAGLGGLVRSDEPVWFNEGFAEFWSAVAKVVAYPRRISWQTHHVVRERDFYDWAHACTQSLRSLRAASPQSNGCEYHLGLIAVEYLYANYHSLDRTINAFRHAADYATFEDGFLGTFGITLDQFEAEAGAFIESLRRAQLGH